MKKNKPGLLYRLFDSNVYGKISQVMLFLGALSLVAGQFLTANILIAIGGVALGTSIVKNIIEANAERKSNQTEIAFEEYHPEKELQANKAVSQVKLYEKEKTSSKSNSNERSL